MPEPCRSCNRREIDWGGCRCQAYALTGDAERTDPTCALAPDHGLLVELCQDANEAAPVQCDFSLVHADPGGVRDPSNRN